MTSAPLIFTPEYYDRMRRLERVSWWNAGMREIAASLLEDASLPMAGTMLDVGCGSGQTMTWFQTLYQEWRTFGFDVATEGVTAARAAGRSVSRASALKIPFASGTIDLVITLDVLQHLPLDGGDLHALQEIRRVLKPGGYLFVRTNAQAFPRTAPDREFEFRKYTPAELGQLLALAGFTVERLSRVNALLGLAEIPRELRARRTGAGYHGLLAQPRSEAAWTDGLKLQWLRSERALVRRGIRLPFGRSIVALGRT